MDSSFIKLYFGKDKQRLISYAEFSQFLHDFHEEYAVEAFKKFDKDGQGFISALDFQDIMLSIKSHLLTKDVRDNLVAAASTGQGGRKVSFPYSWRSIPSCTIWNLLNVFTLTRRTAIDSKKY